MMRSGIHVFLTAPACDVWQLSCALSPRGGQESGARPRNSERDLPPLALSGKGVGGIVRGRGEQRGEKARCTRWFGWVKMANRLLLPI